MSYKKTILSGATVTGNLTLGNYIGAIANWKRMQEEYDCFYFIADLHALTVPQKPEEFRRRCLSFFAQYLALGLDPQKNTLFVQSRIHEHAELAWVLTCLTPMGYLNRMTQFKEKSAKSINAGIFSYPVLMAADILLYRADLVPVGEDQKQHLELCRDVVTFFSNAYGSGVFVLPEGHIPKIGSRVMSLTDPTKKMSKSDENEKSYVAIIDPPKKVRKKIQSAVTDSGSEITYEPEQKPGLANLLNIYAVLNEESVDSLVARYRGKMYGHLKVDLADLVVETLTPFREKYEDLMKNPDYLEEVMRRGEERARERASETLARVYDRIGLLPRADSTKGP